MRAAWADTWSSICAASRTADDLKAPEPMPCPAARCIEFRTFPVFPAFTVFLLALRGGMSVQIRVHWLEQTLITLITLVSHLRRGSGHSQTWPATLGGTA